MSAPNLCIAALHARYAAGESPATVLAEIARRQEDLDDPGIFITVTPADRLAADCATLPPFDPVAHPLWGIPFAVKDNIDVAGLPTTAACPAFAHVPTRDATVVARLRAAGAIVIGKTNLDQFATGLVGTRSPYPIPRNALDPRLVPGGSSSGSAVAVAQGLACFALGTDTAGSGRVPAGLNGIVGLKPSLGLLSATGMVPACRTLDTISVFAAGVADAWRVTCAAAGFDPEDAYSRPLPPPRLDARAHPVIGVPDAASRIFFGDTLQAQAFAAALARLEALGAELREIDLTPCFDVARMLYEGAWVAERMAAIEPWMQDGAPEVHPVTRAIVGQAEGLSAVDAFRGVYRLAELRRAAEPMLAGLDLICVPTYPRPVTLDEIAADPVTPNARLGTYTNFVNLMDLCGLAVPTAPRADGLPGSVTLLGRAGADGLLADIGALIEADAALSPGAGLARPTPLPLPAPTPDELVIAAVGAHMSGLPLNNELTTLGARCLGPARTAPGYRLYLLPGGVVAKPGLVRDGTGGDGIAVELWAVPLAQVGRFLAGIPAPLGLGTIALDDGRQCKGFLSETHALRGATEITGFGGWRAWLAAQAGGARATAAQ